MVRPNPCNTCRINSRKCDQNQPCGNCVKSRVAHCVYDVSPKTPPRPSCARCRSFHKKCDLVAPTCGRCFKAYADCVYPPAMNTPEKTHQDITDSSHETTSQAHNVFYETIQPTLLLKIVDAATATEDMVPGVRDAAAHATSLVDPDFLPTLQDYCLVARYIQSNKISPEVACDIDLSTFLANFFIEPPPLRMVLCAHAAKAFHHELSNDTVYSYYRRARKTVSQFMDKPSLRMVQALLFLVQISDGTGQSEFADLIFRYTIEMLLSLRMDLDPDHAFWRATSNLTEIQKEEHRRIFWRCAFWIKLRSTFGQITQPYVLDVNQVQLPRNLQRGPFTILAAGSDFVVNARRIHTKIPSSIHEMIVSHELIELNAHLMGLMAGIPAPMILISTRETPLDQQFKIFTNQLMHLDGVSQFNIITLSLGYFSSVCLTHRPRMYLTAFLPSGSFYLTSPQYASELISSLAQSVDTAQHIGRVFMFLLLATQEYNLKTNLSSIFQPTFDIPKLFPPSFWTWGCAIGIFECSISLWFALCKVPPEWKHRIGFDETAAKLSLLIFREFVDLVQLNLRGGSESVPTHSNSASPNPVNDRDATPTVISPIVTCIHAMVSEVFELHIFEASRESTPSSTTTNTVAEPLELSMTVLSLTEKGELKPIRTQESPYAMMGLLGVEVKGGIRWRAGYEKGWRHFWRNLHLMER
ncbi:hypothetical protein CcCBS67573_g08166 [Chytriomyces confervae]|uniref:Zn(2)-C6 fungal-type domain-containing protein n=1 Tax=Chytriomyces confervae TaxID=246404 RepID=A0A507EQ89_9FUNG|nr:hypothetical protein CcCBS67573_g08166 [Chytriomyces confervae]